MLRDADTAMYRAKARGRGQHVLFDEAMHHNVVERMRLESELRLALDRYEFELEYQPVIRTADMRIEGFEALLRWRSPSRGLVAPGSFIGTAEETGLIVPIGEWVLRQSCYQLGKWLKRFGQAIPLTASVNLSACQVAQPSLKKTIEAILDERQVEGKNLRLEFTESVAMQEPESTAELIDAFGLLGVSFSIDDFGTGYSSLEYLDRFAIDTLKIDRHFISRMLLDERSRNIVKAMIGLAHTLKIQVVAEGVESKGQADLLREMGCEYLQGFYFSQPASAEQFEELLKTQIAMDKAGRAEHQAQ